MDVDVLCKRFKTSVENGLTDELVEAGIKVVACPIMFIWSYKRSKMTS